MPDASHLTFLFSGYVNMSSVVKTMAFGRNKDLEWIHYSDLCLKVRGDGRKYMINIRTEAEFDLAWNDLYKFPLFTRGGPYWQKVRVSAACLAKNVMSPYVSIRSMFITLSSSCFQIPFSKFYFTNRSAIQDNQMPVERHRIKGIGITLSDRIDGPFSLELDQIHVLLRDGSFVERFAYEDYVLPIKNLNQ